ncbi:MAG: ATP-binding cassette domain-containing protein [Varibaculum sp.]|nr:ATP-binding cassette domain-containing protein [Varibaculum sp.]
MLEISNLVKHYRNGAGITSIDFTVQRGQVCGIVGPNGAGKSTLFEVIAGVSDSDSGDVLFQTVPIVEVSRSSVGYLPQQAYAFENFTCRQFYKFDAVMRGITVKNEESSLMRFKCDDFIDAPINQLSQGMERRLALACAFSGEPQLLILDEPLNSVDIQTTLILKDEIMRATRRGAIVLVSSHVLSFLDGLADEVVVLDNGRVKRKVCLETTDAETAYRSTFGFGNVDDER